MSVIQAGARIGGRYRIDRAIASGGMGAVWQGWDERLLRPVAIKVLHAQPWVTMADRDAGAQRAMREARITARLHHPHAVQVFDLVFDGDSPCLIMEFVPSRNLSDVLEHNGPLSPYDAARIGAQVASALAAAHGVGIVHRDVKPGNILIAEDGSAKITDFGISHAFDDVRVTSTGMMTGTPAYLAPEVARGGASDFASDVHSLGATLYTAVEDRPPFGPADNPMAILHQVAAGQWQPPIRSGPITPVMTAMMSLDAARRPTMIEIASRLSNLLPAVGPLPAGDATQTLTPRLPAPPAAPSPGGASLPGDDTRVYANPLQQTRQAATVPPQDRARSWIPIAAAVLVAALAIAVAVVELGGTSTSGQHANSARTSTAPTSTATGASSGNGSLASSQQLANAVIDYFTLIPGNLDAGWARLTPHFQSTTAHGRQSYDEYWGSVAHVDVSNARGEPPNGASATLTYHYNNGRVVTEHTHLRFVRQSGLLKIDEQTG